jgi:hypothetical protein
MTNLFMGARYVAESSIAYFHHHAPATATLYVFAAAKQNTADARIGDIADFDDRPIFVVAARQRKWLRLAYLQMQALLALARLFPGFAEYDFFHRNLLFGTLT